jgi:serine protease AprX
VLPSAFYHGRTAALRATAVGFALAFASAAVFGASGIVDLRLLVGPHVNGSAWAFSMIGAPGLRALGLTGKGITVCVVDTGLDVLHPDLDGVRIVAWKDYVNLRPEPYDDGAHGTSMTGLIVARGGLRGVAPDVSLIVVKALNSAGDGSSQNVADGIRFCVDPFANGTGGADIVSLSLGSKAKGFVESRVYAAVLWATSKGVFVVAAAGNDGMLDDGDVGVAGIAPLAFSVGAVDSDGSRAPFSSMGFDPNRTDPNLKPEVVAPGVRIVSTGLGAHYLTVSGTSPATALVAGILALLLEAKPYLRPGQSPNNILVLKSALAAHARRARGQQTPHDPWLGYGIIDGPATLPYL